MKLSTSITLLLASLAVASFAPAISLAQAPTCKYTPSIVISGVQPQWIETAMERNPPETFLFISRTELPSWWSWRPSTHSGGASKSPFREPR